MPLDGTDIASDVAILLAARDGIADPERWCQCVLDVGEAHCVMGWLCVVAPVNVIELTSRHLFPALPWHRRQMAGADAFTVTGRAMAVVRFQDTFWRRHAAVVALFDRAIARLEAP